MTRRRPPPQQWEKQKQDEVRRHNGDE